VPPLQTLPQPPQLLGSLAVGMQLPPQSAVPLGQAQVPPLQLAPKEQTFPHAPQLSKLLRVSTHDEPHCLSAPQPVAQAPFKQTSLLAHAWPQLPQFAASDAVSVHAPSQSMRPLGQLH